MSDDLLPSNATLAEKALAATTKRIDDVRAAVRDVWDPDTCPENLLPWLAWAFSVDDWKPSWTVQQKREVIRKSIRVHRYKGTIGAVKEALGALGFDAQVVEWFNQIPAADPYTFIVNLTASQYGWTQNDLQLILSVIYSSKNLRSHLTELNPILQSEARTYVASVVGIGHEITVDYEAPATEGEPDFGTLFDSMSFIGGEPTFAHEISGGGETLFLYGDTSDCSLTGYFSTAGRSGKHLVIAKLTSLVDDPTAGLSVEVGFVRLHFGPDSQVGVYVHGAFNPGNYGNRSGSSAVAIRQNDSENLLALSNFGGQEEILTPQYFAIAYDMDTGHGELLSAWGSGAIEDMPIVSGGSGTLGNELAAEELRAFLSITYNASAHGTTTGGGTYRLDLVPSSAPHGLTLPAGYTNIVPG